jgi:hypothetical protein
MFPSARKRIQQRSERFLFGPPEQWAEELTMLAVELGFDTFIFGDREAPVDHIRQIAAEVIPQVKANVAAARKAAPVPVR